MNEFLTVQRVHECIILIEVILGLTLCFVMQVLKHVRKEISIKFPLLITEKISSKHVAEVYSSLSSN